MLEIQAEQELNGFVVGSKAYSKFQNGEISKFKMWIKKDDAEIFSREMGNITETDFLKYYRQKVKEFTGHDEVVPIDEN